MRVILWRTRRYAMDGNAPWELPWIKARRVKENRRLEMRRAAVGLDFIERRDAVGNMLFWRMVLRAERACFKISESADAFGGALAIRKGMLLNGQAFTPPPAYDGEPLTFWAFLKLWHWPLVTGKPLGYVEDYEGETVEVLTPHSWSGRTWSTLFRPSPMRPPEPECDLCGRAKDDQIHV